MRRSALPAHAARAAWASTAVILLLGLTGLRLATYDPWAHGPWLDLAGAGIRNVLVAAGAAALVRLSAGKPARLARWLACIAAVAVLLAGEVAHYARLRHPLTGTGALILSDDFTAAESLTGAPPAPERWLVETSGAGTADVAGGRLRITVPPSSHAYVDLLVPGISTDPRAFWLPRGLVQTTTPDERLEWRSEVRLDGEYIALVDTGLLRIRATQSGVIVAAEPRPGGVRESEQRVPVPDLYRGAHDFVLERTQGLVRFRMDDVSVWFGQDPGQWRFVRLGETRADALHAGSASIASARYTRRYGAE
jgi:hypothetical protein